MCGRYRRTTREEELARIYHIPIPAQPDLPISDNIAPNQGGTRYPIQSRDETAELGYFALGHGSLLEQAWQNGLYQCPSRKDRYGPSLSPPFSQTWMFDSCQRLL